MKRKMSLLGLICLFTSILMAQTKISGTVTDVDKNPLPGVSVVCKSTSQGTVTNLDGKYTIEINKGNTLTFSLIGMQTQDIKIASQSIINVIMHESTIELDEVVAIGYGTAKKSDLTSSIISVKPDELKNVKIGSAADALQGLATGVLISKDHSNREDLPTSSFAETVHSVTEVPALLRCISLTGSCRMPDWMLSLLPISNRLRY